MTNQSSPGTSALLLCPFCGGEGVMNVRPNAHCWVSCEECLISAPSMSGETQARDRWNRRVGPAQSDKEGRLWAKSILEEFPDVGDDDAIVADAAQAPTPETAAAIARIRSSVLDDDSADLTDADSVEDVRLLFEEYERIAGCAVSSTDAACSYPVGDCTCLLTSKDQAHD